jgi:uncharacterized protein (DUF1778 family)
METKKNLINFKATLDQQNAIKAAAKKANLKPSTYCRAVILKFIKYKEPNLV